MPRHYIYAVLTLVAVVAALEGLAFVFFSLTADVFDFPDPRRYVAEDDEIARARASYDRELGWRIRYATPYGERPRRRERRRPLVSAYGDSFVHGDEVGDGETWAEQAAEILDADVYNFGNSAYGMDQSLLRFERDFARRPTEVVIFGFISYDIERNLGVYWKFQQPESDFAYTKPRFVLDGEELELVPNPVVSAEELGRLRDPEFVRELGALDGWFDRNRLPRPGFPNLRLLLHPSTWRVLARRGRHPDLWTLEEPRRLAEAILLRFHRGCRQRGARPIIVQFPVAWELVGYAERGDVPPGVTAMNDLCRRHGLECVSLLEKIGPLPIDDVAALFTNGAAGGHYTSAGNRRVARILAREISR